MGLRAERETPLKGYRERLRRLDDSQLKREWEADVDAEEWKMADAAEHEMAMRFKGRTGGRQDARAYFWDKLLESAGEFGGMVAAGEYFKAKYLYEKACMLAVFLEMPAELRQQLFGAATDDGVYVDGLFDKKGVNTVMGKCVVWNRLGYDCMVYRIPGEVGYHGARAAPGIRPDRKMHKEENPAYMQEAAGQ